MADPTAVHDGSEELSTHALEVLGVQLYTARHLMEERAEEALALVAEIGYSCVETVGLYGHSPQAMRALLDEHGLESPAGHYPLNQLRSNLGGVIEMAHTLGQHYVVCPYVEEGDRATLDQYRKLADVLNRVGEQVQAAGLQLAYHNHDFEFDALDGQVPYDLLLERTEAARVAMELDLFWMYKAGRDPVGYLGRYPDRFPLLHVKDSTAPPERRITDVGQGVIDFGHIFRATAAGLHYAFVEHDDPPDVRTSLQTSYEHLTNLTY